MASTRDQLAAEVKFALGNRDDLDSWYPVWINRAYQHITKTIEFPQARTSAVLTVVADQHEYTLPTDYFHAYTLRNNDEQAKITRISPATYRTRDTTIRAKPREYTIASGTTLAIYPADAEAGDELLLDYRKTFPSLSDGASVHELYDEWEQAIVQKAMEFAFAFIGAEGQCRVVPID